MTKNGTKRDNTVRNLIVVLLVLGLAGVLYLGWRGPKAVEAGKYDEFAKCLSSKDITMYGAYWCSHCQNEKRAFGTSFQYVKYVECTQETDRCDAQKIGGFPTWIFPDGQRFEGEQGLANLSRNSGCSLPTSSTP